MSFTNQTTNYGLPQWIGTDKPTYLVDQNGAYATIDTELYNANSNASTALSSAASAVEVAGTAATNAQTAIDSAATANTNANSAIATANTAITNAATAQSIAENAASNVNSLFTLVDSHEYASDTTFGAALDAAGTAIASSINTYPFDNYEYIIEFILSYRTVYYKLSRESISENIAGGIAAISHNLIQLCDVSLTGSGSILSMINFGTSGVSRTDISEQTFTGTVKVSAIKRS